LSNAIKFTASGFVEVRASVERPDVMRLAVQDSRVGFDPADRGRVFRRLAQAAGPITRRFGGPGLGLAICQQLAQLMGGGMDCVSTPGQGSTFWVDLPLRPAEPIRDAASQAAAPDGLGAALRVLIADDHATNRKVVDLILTGAGAE